MFKKTIEHHYNWKERGLDINKHPIGLADEYETVKYYIFGVKVYQREAKVTSEGNMFTQYDSQNMYFQHKAKASE